MSSASESPVLADEAPVLADATAVTQTAVASQWLDRLDATAKRIGDGLNPILIKETRQALKSRQFVATFTTLLFAAMGWTVVGSLSMMPQIYTNPSAPRMLIGYYLVLAVPMLLVVPLAAYRSLENEIDDGTLELLSITTLSPWQIVLGKLASAMLQMLLYFVALFPCVAYAYTLRGVDFPTTMLMIGSLMVSGIVLTIVALFFSPLARSRTGRIGTLLMVMLILCLSQFGLGSLNIYMILEGNSLSGVETVYIVAAVVSLSIALSYFLLTATAAQLTPQSENRSTAIRIALLVFAAVLGGVVVMFKQIAGPSLNVVAENHFVLPMMVMLHIGCALWLFCGSLMVAESDSLTPRIRRELPSSFLARMTLTYLTPGPTTGLIFASIGGISFTALAVYCLNDFADRSSTLNLGGVWFSFRRALIASASYAIGLLVLVRWVMWVIRRKNSPRVEVGIAGLVSVMVLTALVPYSIGLHLNDYRNYSYSLWQVTNWAWTVRESFDGNPTASVAVMAIGVASAIGLFVTAASHPKLAFPRRIATPKRVLEERRRMAEAAQDADSVATA